MGQGGGKDDKQTSRTEVLPPTRLLAGKYRLGRLLGEGGMGAVYEGEHTGLGSRVAVKLLSEHLQNERAVARFRREARALAAVRHDNVVTVTDTGTDEEGTPFLVMELLEGESLNALIKRERRLAPEGAVAIALQILSGLAAAHDRGIVHRDLKPGNVFVSWGSEGDRRVKILDFGISKYAEGATRELTAEGTMIGTPHYMAPEQAKGDKDVDHRADLYAVGVLLYRMLTGRLPYDAKPSEGLYEAILSGDVTPPRAVAPGISDALEEVILRAMRVRPEERYADARVMRRAVIDAVPELAGEGTIPPSLPSGTPPPPAEDRLGHAPTLAVAPEGRESVSTARIHAPTAERSAAPTRAERRSGSPSAPDAPSEGRLATVGPTPAPVNDAPPSTPARRPSAGALAAGAVAVIALGAVAWMAASPAAPSNGADAATDPAGEGRSAPPAGEPLLFGISQYLSREQVIARHSPLTDHLGRELGRPVDIVVLEDHEDIASDLASGRVTMAALSPYWYVRAKERSPELRLVATPTRRGNLATYTGMIVVLAESDIGSIEELEGKRFCYAGRHSTSGYIYPSALLRREGFDPYGHFGGVVFADGDHLKALRYLLGGACHGAAVYGTALRQAADEHIAPQEAFHVLRSTERIPYDAYVVSATVEDALAERIEEALLALEPGSEQTLVIVGDADIIGFHAAEDSEYDAVREEMRALEGADAHEVEP